MTKIVWVHLNEIQNYHICNYLLLRKFFLKRKVNEKLVCRGKKLNYMIICLTFNIEFSSYNLLSYRRRQIDLLWKGQRHKMNTIDVTKCKHYTTHFWRRKKIKSQPLCMQCRSCSLKIWMGGIQKLTLGVYSWIKQCLNTVFAFCVFLEEA